MLQGSLWVKPCAKEVCGADKALTTCDSYEDCGLGNRGTERKAGVFHEYEAPVENPFPLHADIPQPMLLRAVAPSP